MRLQFGTNGTAASGIAPAALDTNNSAGRKSGVAGAGGAADQISLSSTSSIINRDATNRAARLQHLTLAIQSGNYQVSSEDLSAKIVAAALAH